MAKTVVVEIDEKGNCNIDLQGFNGVGCAEVAAKFAAALGTTVSETVKPEYYEEEVSNCVTSHNG